MTTPTDHPPAIPPIGVRVIATVDARGWLFVPWGWTATVPLGLSPEQPARLSGEAMP